MNESQREFKQAAIRLAINEELDEQLTAIEHDGAPAFEITADKLRRAQHMIEHGIKRKRRISARTFLLVAAAIASLTLLVSAVYVPIRQVWLRNFGGYTRVSLSDSVENDWNDAYAPTVFPDKCTQRSIQITKSQRVVTYMIDDEPLSFCQYRSVNLGIDTERSESAKDIFKDGFTGWITENDGVQSLYWAQDDFMFALSGRFAESDLLDTAMSVQELY